VLNKRSFVYVLIFLTLFNFINPVNAQKWEAVNYSNPEVIQEQALTVDQINSLTKDMWNEFLNSKKEVSFGYRAVDSSGKDITYEKTQNLSILVEGLNGTENVVFKEELQNNEKENVVADYGLYFDGVDDYVELNSLAQSMSGNLSGTISLWFKAESSVSSFDRALYTVFQPDHNPLSVHLGDSRDITGNQAVAFTDDNGGSSHLTINGYWGSSNSQLYDDNWHHLSFVVGSNFNKIYLDGVLVSLSYNIGSSSSGNFLWRSNTTQMNLGRFFSWNNYEGHYFKGFMKEIQIWDYPLSETEVVNNMDKELEGNEVGLIGYYPANEVSGDILTDKTGNYSGNISGAQFIAQ
jgi:hypothetical protein